LLKKNEVFDHLEYLSSNNIEELALKAQVTVFFFKPELDFIKNNVWKTHL